MSLIEKLTAALDETERIARAAVRHPSRYNSDLRDHEECGVDDGEWTADRCEVISANPHRGDFFHGGIMIYDEGGHNEEQAKHIAHNDPAHVLRQVAAHRKLLKLHYEIHRDIGWMEDGDEVQQELPVCGHCVPKHSWFKTRADVPLYPCETAKIVAEIYGMEVSSNG